MGASVFTNMHLINWYINIKDLIWGIASKGYLNAFMQSLWHWTTLLWFQHEATITMEWGTVMKKTLLAPEGGRNRSRIMYVYLVWNNQALSPDNSRRLAVTFLLPTYVNTSVLIALQVALHILNMQNKTHRPASDSMDGFVSTHQITNIKALAADTCSGKTTERSAAGICCHRCDR